MALTLLRYYGLSIRQPRAQPRFMLGVDTLSTGEEDVLVRVPEIVGRNVRRAREERGLTQAELGQRLELVLGRAWSTQAVSAAEKGRRNFAAEDVMGLALVLEHPVADFFNVVENVEIELPGRTFGGGLVEALQTMAPEESVEHLADALLRTARALSRAVKEGRKSLEIVINPEDSPEARWLYAIPGNKIPLEEARRLGLLGDEAAVDEPGTAESAEDESADKAAPKPADKAARPKRTKEE